MQGRGVDQANPECQAHSQGDLWIQKHLGLELRKLHADFPPVNYKLLRTNNGCHNPVA